MYECNHCTKTFSTKICLQKHLKQHTSNRQLRKCNFTIHDNQNNECGVCFKSFKSGNYLRKHLLIHISRAEKLKCNQCNKEFRKKSSMDKHLNNFHTQVNCEICKKVFKNRRTLFLHSKVHDTNFEERYECDICGSVTKLRTNIIKHLRRHDNDSKKKTIKCIQCDFSSSSKLLRMHYAEVHNLILSYHEFTFKSIDEFDKWRVAEENNVNVLTRFVIRDKYKTKQFTRIHYICHRSGMYTSKTSPNQRKRALKISGYKHLNGVCPAEIKLHVYNNGECRVTYQSSHVVNEKHTGTVEQELKYIYIKESDRKRIAAKISMGASVDDIHIDERLNAENANPLSILSKKQLQNIAVQNGLNMEGNKKKRHEECTIVKDKSNEIQLVEKEIIRNYRDVLLYKKEGESKLMRNTLNKDVELAINDFVLVIMSTEQQENLHHFGHIIISMDSHFILHHNSRLMLHTVLVFNDLGTEIPVAFVMSNRNDESLMILFLECIKERVGIVKTHTFMSDMQQTTYQNSWEQVMGPPDLYLYSSYYVIRTWDKLLKKIKGGAKFKNSIKCKLIKMMINFNIAEFETELVDFIKVQNENISDFRDSFVQQFIVATSPQTWAYCYRTNNDLNVNTSLKVYYSRLKGAVIDGNKAKSVSQYLRYLFQLVDLQNSELRKIKIKGKLTTKLKKIHSFHKQAHEYFVLEGNDCITTFNDDHYLVQSWTTDEHYIIGRNIKCLNKSCPLICEICKICWHEFSCSCHEAIINRNMCKHIHLVGIHIQNEMTITVQETYASEPIKLTTNRDIENILLDDELDTIDPFIQSTILSIHDSQNGYDSDQMIDEDNR